MTYTAPHTPSFREVAERWLAALEGAVSEKTVRHYRTVLERYVLPDLGERPIGEGRPGGQRPGVTEEDVRALIDRRKAEGLSENTVYSIPKLIWRILSYASSEGLCPAPGWDIGKGRPKKTSPTIILTRAQEQRLIAFLTENPTPKHLSIYLMLTAGIALNEVLALTWADVSFRQNQLRVQARLVPIDERQKIQLKKQSSLPTVYLASGTPKQISPGVLRSRFVAVLKELNLPEMPLTDLRRTFAVRCLEGGMRYDALAKVLGQKDDGHFRAVYRELVSEETEARLEQEHIASRKPRRAPKHIRPPEKDPDISALERKIEDRKARLRETLDNLEGDLAIIQTLRNSDCVQGQAREGFYKYVEKVLGDDKDGRLVVEYLRNNMRVAAMPSREHLSVQAIRRRIARGFAKLSEALESLRQEG